MGVVYKARDPLIGRLVALKTITAGLADNQELLQRFYREAQSAGGLQHPNIVTVYDLGEENQMPYIAMEFIEGTSLENVIQKKEAISLSQKLGYVVQVCRGLGYAHQRGVVHRDIKPANIMMTKEGVVKIVDFGIARVMAASKTQSGLFIGTVAYMSPEQVRGEHVDGRSDIWSVGVMFYELLTWVRPFAADNMAAMMFNIVSQEPKPLRELLPDASAELEAVLHKILRKETPERFQSMEEVLLDLEPIYKRLQSDVVGQLVVESQQLIEGGDFIKARELLRQAAQLDTAHSQVKQLLEKVNVELKRSQVLPRLQEMLSKADTLLKSGKVAEAAAEAESALKLDSAYEPAQDMMKLVREKLDLANKVREALQSSKKRLAEGDLTGAEKQVDEVLALEADNPQVQELKRQIQEEKARREKKRLFGDRLQRARNLWTQQKFAECMGLLTELDKEFPNEPEVQSLLTSARADQSEAEKQAHLSEARNLLGEQKFSESLAILDTLLELNPTDSSVKRLRERVIEERKEHAKRIRLQHEHQALKKLVSDGKYAEAIQRAETLLGEFPGQFELQQLMDFARSQQEQAEQKRRLDAKIHELRELMEQGEFKQALEGAEQALVVHRENRELQEILNAARIKRKEQEDREKKEFIEKQLRAMKAAIEREDYTGAIDLAQKTQVLAGEHKDITRMMQLAQRERELRDRNREAQEHFKTAIFRMDEGKFDEAEKILEDVQKTHIFDARVHKLLEVAREKKPLPATDETRIGIFGPGGEVITPGAPAKEAEREYLYVAPKPPAEQPVEAADLREGDRTMVGRPQQVAQALAQPQIVEPPAVAPPPPPTAMPPVPEPPAAPPVAPRKPAVEKEKKKVKGKPVVEKAAPPPAKPVEAKPAAPAVEKVAPTAPAVEKAPPAVEKAPPPPVEKPRPPVEEKKPAVAKPGAYEETVPVFKPKKEKPGEAPAAAIPVPLPLEVPAWKKPAVLGGIAAVVVLGVVIGVVITKQGPSEQRGTAGTGSEVISPQRTAPTTAAGPTADQLQGKAMDEAQTLIASKKYDAAEQKLQQAKSISGGSRGAEIDVLLKKIGEVKGNVELQVLLAKEDRVFQSGVKAYNSNKVSDARRAFDEVSKMQQGARRADALDYLNKRIPDLEKANGLLSQAQQLAGKKDKGSLEQAKNLVTQVIAMNGPRTQDARNLEGNISKALDALAGAEAAAARERRINDLRSGAAQDIQREDYSSARAKADEIRGLGGNPSDVVSTIDRAEQTKSGLLQSQFDRAKNDANALRQLQNDLQKYTGMGGRVGEKAQELVAKIPAELDRLAAASRPAPTPPSAAAITPVAPLRTAKAEVVSLAAQKWTQPLSAGQLVNSRYLDGGPKLEREAIVPSEIIQRAAVGSTLQVEVDVNESGQVTGGRVQSGDDAVGKAIVELAKSAWKFAPPRVNGKPVTTRVTMRVRF